MGRAWRPRSAARHSRPTPRHGPTQARLGAGIARPQLVPGMGRDRVSFSDHPDVTADTPLSSRLSSWAGASGRKHPHMPPRRPDARRTPHTAHPHTHTGHILVSIESTKRRSPRAAFGRMLTGPSQIQTVPAARLNPPPRVQSHSGSDPLLKPL